MGEGLEIEMPKGDGGGPHYGLRFEVYASPECDGFGDAKDDKRFSIRDDRSDDRDILMTIGKNVSLERAATSKEYCMRLATLLVGLVTLAKEDERLRELMLRYKIEVQHGDTQLWPPKT